MPLAINSSLRDIAGKKPWRSFTTIAQASTGTFSQTVFSPYSGQTNEITDAIIYWASGSITGTFQLVLYDGTTYGVIVRAYNPTTQVTYGGPCSCPVELPSYVQMTYTVTTAPTNVYVSLVGWAYVSGEGALD